MIEGIVIVAAVLILIALDDVEKEIKGLCRDLKKYNKDKIEV
jgi:hypothetical protein